MITRPQIQIGESYRFKNTDLLSRRSNLGIEADVLWFDTTFKASTGHNQRASYYYKMDRVFNKTDPNNYEIGEMSVGDVSNVPIQNHRSFSGSGVRIRSLNQYSRQKYAPSMIEGFTDADAILEIYINDRLFFTKKSDDNGY